MEFMQRKTVMQQLQNIFESAFYMSFPKVLIDKKLQKIVSNSVMISQHADYHSIIGWSFYSWIKKKKLLGKEDHPNSKREIVSKMYDHIISKNWTIIGNITITENDYMNITISSSWLFENLLEIHDLPPPAIPRKKVVVDYSSPNIAKTMHVGHLRSTIIGNCVYKLLKYCGHEVIGLNHFGDCGTQFGMLLEYIHANHPNFLEESWNIHDLEKMYKSSKVHFDSDEEFKKNAKLRVVELQSDEGWAHSIWKKLVEISKENYQQIYDLLEITDLIDRGESYYIPYLPKLVTHLQEMGIVEEDNGAKVIRVPKHKGVFMVQKSDGGYGYDSTDLAAIRQRITEMNADHIVYVTDIGQQLHFHKLFDAARMIGWCDQKDIRLDHLGFGLILSKEGGKFRTRSGKVVHLIDLLNEAKERSLKILEERVSSGQCKMTQDEIETTAAKIGYGSVKYFDLQMNINKNYVFDYDKMLSMSGNTAVYLQYTYARLNSIINTFYRNYEITGPQKSIHHWSHRIKELEDGKEHELGVILSRYMDVILNTHTKLTPCLLCDYVYKVASKFNEFYNACPVINSERMKVRIVLCTLTQKILEKFMNLLGIHVITKM